MTRPHSRHVAEGFGSGWFENTLLSVVLAVTVLRLTIIETPLIEDAQGRWLSFENISLLLSAVLLLCGGLWILTAAVSGRFFWRKTWFGCGVGVFIAAGIIAAVLASNKRAAITELVILATPMLSALLLVQLLTSGVKIRLALLVILAVGAAATVLCLMQASFLNDDIIKNYEENPGEALAKQNIDPNSLEHWMYEHRMYSKDIRGFLLTSNSAASFFLLAIFAAMGLCAGAFSDFMKPGSWANREQILVALLCYFFGFAVVLLGLALTRSKGGIGAFGLGFLLFITMLVFGKTLWKRRRVFGIGFLLLILIGAGLIVHYGIEHGRLPGGNAMLVRWQYWAGTARMIGDHFLTGVGGGNFPEFYTHYKIPAALETVQNPHNWILSLLSQYGPLGLLAFAGMIMVVFFKGLQNVYRYNDNQNLQSPVSPGLLWVIMLILSLLMLLIVRPVLVDLEFLRQKPDVAVWAYLFLYMFPAGVFVLVFIILKAASNHHAPAGGNDRYLFLALICGQAAVLIHNIIDFAIFEPGIWSTFWLFAAIVIAYIHNCRGQTNQAILLGPAKRLGLFSGLLIIGIGYPAIVLLPPLRAEWLFKRAMAANTRGFELTDQAVAADILSAKIPFQAANLLTQIYQNRGMNDQAFLDRAVGFADIAIRRNPADFKPWRLRAKINVIRSEQTDGQVEQAALEKALEDLQRAIACYPGSDKLHFLLANVAEQLGLNDVALRHYQAAVEIEDAYREQFRIMYPDRDTIISRLGEACYIEAKAKIQALQRNTPEIR